MPGAVHEFFEELPEIPELPRHEQIGGIALMQEEDRAEANRLLASRPSIHTVLLPLSDVEGEYRTRRFEVLAGIPTTRTRYVEYGYRFDIDLALAYFSARLSNERQRVLSMVSPGERILDMFAGVGPFSIVLSEKAAVVTAVDINPDAIHLLIDNVHLNRRPNILPMLADAARLDHIFEKPFDRVIMNLPVASWNFLDPAFRLTRDGGTIHFYVLQSQEGEYRRSLEKMGGVIEGERMVRSYSPARWHAVYDVRVRKRESQGCSIGTNLVP
ncbi:MAG TPA: methyltransferase, partial [Methanomicrobiales archaeon]|nr:methyltransferase [Methanomicrobiales archaeon]